MKCRYYVIEVLCQNNKPKLTTNLIKKKGKKGGREIEIEKTAESCDVNSLRDKWKLRGVRMERIQRGVIKQLKQNFLKAWFRHRSDLPNQWFRKSIKP